MEYFFKYNSCLKFRKGVFFLTALCLSLIYSNKLHAQLIFDAKGIDSILINSKISAYCVSDLKPKNLLYSELGILKIDGDCYIEKSKIHENRPTVEKIYCRRVGGKIHTLYWILAKNDSSIVNRLLAFYGRPYQKIRSIIRSSDDQPVSMVWVFSNYSIYYMADFLQLRNKDLIVVNYHQEADFYRAFDEIKSLR